MLTYMIPQEEYLADCEARGLLRAHLNMLIDAARHVMDAWPNPCPTRSCKTEGEHWPLCPIASLKRQMQMAREALAEERQGRKE